MWEMSYLSKIYVHMQLLSLRLVYVVRLADGEPPVKRLHIYVAGTSFGPNANRNQAWPRTQNSDNPIPLYSTCNHHRPTTPAYSRLQNETTPPDSP